MAVWKAVLTVELSVGIKFAGIVSYGLQLKIYVEFSHLILICVTNTTTLDPWSLKKFLESNTTDLS